MRSAEQIGRTVEQYRAYKEAEMERHRADALRHFAQLRRNRPEWYRWATEGQPRLTHEEYDRVKAERRKRPASK